MQHRVIATELIFLITLLLLPAAANHENGISKRETGWIPNSSRLLKKVGRWSTHITENKVIEIFWMSVYNFSDLTSSVTFDKFDCISCI